MNRIAVVTLPMILILSIVLISLSYDGTANQDTEANKAVVRKFVEEFKNKQRLEAVDELFTSDFTHHLKGPFAEGREGFRQLGGGIFMAFPDVHVTIKDTVAEGNKVVERSVVSATHKGEFMGVPASGKTVTWTEMHFYRLDGGKIAEIHSEIDMLGLLQQIGAIPSPGGGN